MMDEIGYRYNALVHTKPCRVITRSIGDAEMLLSVMKTLSSRDLCMNTDPPAGKCPFPWVTVRHNLPQMLSLVTAFRVRHEFLTIVGKSVLKGRLKKRLLRRP